jgi:hypothetical protein
MTASSSRPARKSKSPTFRGNTGRRTKKGGCRETKERHRQQRASSHFRIVPPGSKAQFLGHILRADYSLSQHPEANEVQFSPLDETEQWWKRYFGDSFESRNAAILLRKCLLQRQREIRDFHSTNSKNRLLPLTTIPLTTEYTTFTRDVFGRYICNTYDEALARLRVCPLAATCDRLTSLS